MSGDRGVENLEYDYTPRISSPVGFRIMLHCHLLSDMNSGKLPIWLYLVFQLVDSN